MSATCGVIGRRRRAASASWRLPGGLTRSAGGLNRVGRRGSRRSNPSEWSPSPRARTCALWWCQSTNPAVRKKSTGNARRDRPAPWMCLREPSPHATRARRCLNFSADEPSKKKPCASCSSPTPLTAGMVEHRPSRLLEPRYGSHCDLAACWANGGRALGGKSLALGEFCRLFPDRGLIRLNDPWYNTKTR